jgi:hypothetical protein
MRFIADENFPKPVIDRLRLAHDLVWAGTDFPSAEDKWLLDRAEDDARILLTLTGISGSSLFSDGSGSARSP